MLKIMNGLGGRNQKNVLKLRLSVIFKLMKKYRHQENNPK